jgi:hypothetical protein
MPGPPNEFQPMATEYVLPRLAARTGGRVIRSRVLRLCGIGESDAEAQLQDLIASENPTLAPLAKLGEVHFRITARADSPEQAEQMIATMEREVRARLGAYIFGTDDTTLEQAVVQSLIAAGQSLVVAESCTGGLLANRITKTSSMPMQSPSGFASFCRLRWRRAGCAWSRLSCRATRLRSRSPSQARSNSKCPCASTCWNCRTPANGCDSLTKSCKP